MEETIASDFKNAMKSQDKFKLSVLRMLKTALQMEAINKKHELNDEEIINVIKKQVKIRKASIEEYQKYQKKAEVELLNQEIDILTNYLPEEASEEQIIEAINTAFDIIKPSSMKDMGTIMQKVLALLPNADRSTVSKMVKEKLS